MCVACNNAGLISSCHTLNTYFQQLNTKNWSKALCKITVTQNWSKSLQSSKRCGEPVCHLCAYASLLPPLTHIQLSQCSHTETWAPGGRTKAFPYTCRSPHVVGLIPKQQATALTRRLPFLQGALCFFWGLWVVLSICGGNLMRKIACWCSLPPLSPESAILTLTAKWKKAELSMGGSLKQQQWHFLFIWKILLQILLFNVV